MKQVTLALLSIVLAVLLASPALAQKHPDDALANPRAIVPYLRKAPTLDGKLSPGEYDGAAGFTGMVSWGGAGGALKSAVPDLQQVTWYLGYDDQYFYIAMHSPNPPGVWPLALQKGRDGTNRILWDDHVEIQIAKDRATATLHGKGFYKIVANAKEAINDDWYYNGTPGTEADWSILGPLKCSVTKEAWQMELAIDKRAMQMKKLTGEELVLQLLRADKPGGIYFAGWVGQPWMAWSKFGSVVFDDAAPAFRFNRMGRLTRGDMNLGFEITGQTDAEVPVTVKATAVDGNGKVLFDKSRTVKVKRGQIEKVDFAQKLALTDRDNRLDILATYPRQTEDGQATEVLYRTSMPIIKLTDAFYDTHVKPWLAERPKGDLAWRFAWWPSMGVAKNVIDVDFFGLPTEVENAGAFKVTVTSRDGAKQFASDRADIQNKAGRMVLKGLDLPEGAYRATMELIGPDGQKTVATKTVDFVSKRYPWEGNRLGISDKVLPPHQPIEADPQKKTLKVFARTYTVGDDGLLAKIVAGGGRGNENILTAPVRLEAEAGGRTSTVDGARSTFDEATPGHVNVSSRGTLAGATCTVEARMEYDGWYHVKLGVDPGAGPLDLDRLTLVVPLWSNANTLYMQRAGDGRAGNAFGAVPEGKGTVWSSTQLPPFGQWGSFLPIAYLGDGDKGLWWFAVDRRPWTLSDKRGAVEVVRTDKGVELHVNFIAEKARLGEARTFEFAFLADPVKQIPDERQWQWGRLKYSHNTFGYRYYGGSVDGFENSDEDLEALKRVLTDPTWRPQLEDNTAHGRSHSTSFRGRHYPAIVKGQMLTVYGSTFLTGAGLPALDSYGGEWLGATNWETSVQSEFKGEWNTQGTVQWTTPRQLTTVGINFNRAYEDCFVWHHHRLLAATPINGTWWDNRSICVIEDYDKTTGEFYQRFNVFTRRRLSKRLNTIGWELNRRPWWISNLHVDWSFNQVAWHIENDYYMDNPEATMTDTLSVDEFRALARIKRGIVHRLHTSIKKGSTEQYRRAVRSAVGMCLLHDIGSYNVGTRGAAGGEMVDLVDELTGYFAGAEFIGYWRQDLPITLDKKGVYASVYRGRDRAVVVVVSELKGPQEVPFELNKNILRGGMKRMTDAETGRQFSMLRTPKVKGQPQKTLLGEFSAGTFGMPDRGVRIFVVE